MYLWERHLNALLMVILSAILWGALAIQFFWHETPCPLCLLQRLGMIGVAAGAFMNVRLGISRAHYGLSLFSALLGGFVAIRQIALHICPNSPTFGVPFWGLSLYTWSFITFVSSVAYIAIMLIVFNKNDRHRYEILKLDIWDDIAFWLIFLVTIANVIATSFQCGIFGPCAE